MGDLQTRQLMAVSTLLSLNQSPELNSGHQVQGQAGTSINGAIPQPMWAIYHSNMGAPIIYAIHTQGDCGKIIWKSCKRQAVTEAPGLGNDQGRTRECLTVHKMQSDRGESIQNLDQQAERKRSEDFQADIAIQRVSKISPKRRVVITRTPSINSKQSKCGSQIMLMFVPTLKRLPSV